MKLIHHIDDDLNKLLSELFNYFNYDRYTAQFRPSYEADVRKKLNIYFFGKDYNIKEQVYDLFKKCRVGGKVILEDSIPLIVYNVNKSTIDGYLSFLVRCGYITKFANPPRTYKLNCRIPANLKLTDIKCKDDLMRIKRSVKIKTLGIK